MLTVHHLTTSQSERVVWLCEELSIEYKLVRHERRRCGDEARHRHSSMSAMCCERQTGTSLMNSKIGSAQ